MGGWQVGSVCSICNICQRVIICNICQRARTLSSGFKLQPVIINEKVKPPWFTDMCLFIYGTQWGGLPQILKYRTISVAEQVIFLVAWHTDFSSDPPHHWGHKLDLIWGNTFRWNRCGLRHRKSGVDICFGTNLLTLSNRESVFINTGKNNY